VCVYVLLLLITSITIITYVIHSLKNICINTMQTFGSQVWDTSFAIQALLATNLIEEIGPALAKGHDFITKSQVCLILMTSI
jgi:squalene cyclase